MNVTYYVLITADNINIALPNVANAGKMYKRYYGLSAKISAN